MIPTDEALVSRGEAAALGLVVTIAGAVVTVLLGGALSGLVFGRGWAWPPTGQLRSTLGDLVTHPGEPSAAYGRSLGSLLPGPGRDKRQGARLRPRPAAGLAHPVPVGHRGRMRRRP